MRRTVAYFSDGSTFGGTERVVLSLLESVDRAQWRPLLLLGGGSGSEGFAGMARRLEVPVYSVPPMPEGVAGAVRAVAFARTLQSLHPDVFHAHLTWALSCKYGLAGALLARVPAVVATQHLYIDAPLTRWQAVQHRLIMSRLGCITAVSRSIAGHLVNDLHTSPARISVVHNGIPLGPSCRRQSSSGRDIVGQNTESRTVLVPARLDPQKGHRSILEAARLLPDVRFLLAGDGPLRGKLQRKAEQLGVADRVHFLGFQASMAALYVQCDVVCLASLFEGLPLALLEAMAAARPVVASRIAGIDEIVVDGETGLLVEPEDPQALAHALNSLLRDPVRAEAFGAQGRQRVERAFSAGLMADRFSQIYERLLTGKS